MQRKIFHDVCGVHKNKKALVDWYSVAEFIRSAVAFPIGTNEHAFPKKKKKKRPHPLTFLGISDGNVFDIRWNNFTSCEKFIAYNDFRL